MVCLVAGNERSHHPTRGYMTFSEAILKTGVFLSLHPFIDQVLDHFDIVPFQLPPNSRHLIVVFYITFSEFYGVAPLIVHFVFIYRLKAFAKHVGFWYLIGQEDAAGITRLPSNTGPWKNNFFFYPSKRYGEFRAGYK